MLELERSTSYSAPPACAGAVCMAAAGTVCVTEPLVAAPRVADGDFPLLSAVQLRVHHPTLLRRTRASTRCAFAARVQQATVLGAPKGRAPHALCPPPPLGYVLVDKIF